MGDYTNRAEVVNGVGGLERLVQLTDYDNDGLEDAGIVDQAIEDAEGEVNSYARKVFAVPFNPVPPIIKTVARKLAVYNLVSQRSQITETQRLEQEDRIKWLQNLASGKVDPGIAPAPSASGRNRSTSTPRSSANAGARANFKGFA